MWFCIFPNCFTCFSTLKTYPGLKLDFEANNRTKIESTLIPLNPRLESITNILYFCTQSTLCWNEISYLMSTQLKQRQLVLASLMLPAQHKKRWQWEMKVLLFKFDTLLIIMTILKCGMCWFCCLRASLELALNLLIHLTRFL